MDAQVPRKDVYELLAQPMKNDKYKGKSLADRVLLYWEIRRLRDCNDHKKTLNG